MKLTLLSVFFLGLPLKAFCMDDHSHYISAREIHKEVLDVLKEQGLCSGDEMECWRKGIYFHTNGNPLIFSFYEISDSEVIEKIKSKIIGGRERIVSSGMDKFGLKILFFFRKKDSYGLFSSSDMKFEVKESK